MHTHTDTHTNIHPYSQAQTQAHTHTHIAPVVERGTSHSAEWGRGKESRTVQRDTERKHTHQDVCCMKVSIGLFLQNLKVIRGSGG